MTVLTRKKIFDEIKKNNIIIQPFNKNQVGTGSIDLSLSDRLRIFNKTTKASKITEEADYKKITKKVRISKSKPFILRPNETILAGTKEKITLSANLCGWIEGRSRFARFGLGVHVSAGFIHPGTSNNPVLEVTNLGPISLVLIPGVKICQVIIERCEGEETYQGKFKDQNQA